MRFIYTKTFRRLFAAFALICLLVIADIQGYLSFAKSGAQRFFGSASSAVTRGVDGLKTTWETFGSVRNLARSNAELEQRVDELSFENARLQSAKQENLALRRALSFLEQATFSLMPAEVISQDPTGFTQTIVIDKGESSGLRVGQPVIVSPGLLVGKISKTYRNSAEVRLMTDPNASVNAEVADSGARGIVRGEHGISLVLDLVTQNEVIKSGDRLITSGLADDYPRGLLVGEINAIKSSASELFQQAFVTPLADLRNLRFVFVIL